MFAYNIFKMEFGQIGQAERRLAKRNSKGDGVQEMTSGLIRS